MTYHHRDITADDRNQIHNARILELISGEISGKEFVESLINQVGFSEAEAREQWANVRDNFTPAIYQLSSGNKVGFKAGVASEYCAGVITSFYGNSLGVVVDVGHGLRVPFSLYELRVWK